VSEVGPKNLILASGSAVDPGGLEVPVLEEHSWDYRLACDITKASQCEE
jgi:hypothetical protein